jgi:DNA-directed RNA polymerase subunit M/transcription elongation factor TFIIS
MGNKMPKITYPFPKMTNPYKTALEILYQFLKDEVGYEHWAKWMLDDIELWETKQNVEHHLHAYGGMGSFNDITLGGYDFEGIWKNKIFGQIQNMAYCLATGDSLESILENLSNQHHTDEISGWRCRTCGDARINTMDIERVVSSYFIPKLFVEYAQKNTLSEVLKINQAIDSEIVINKRKAIESLIKNSNITLTDHKEWLWTCPKCNSKEVCVYRWTLNENDTQLTEAEDNLGLIKN